jgi:hypothetical protein
MTKDLIHEARMEKIKALKEKIMANEEILYKHCNALLTGMIGADLVEEWWNSANLSFNGDTPRKRWEDNPLSVYDYLMHHAYVGGGS